MAQIGINFVDALPLWSPTVWTSLHACMHATWRLQRATGTGKISASIRLHSFALLNTLVPLYDLQIGQ